MKPDQLMDNFKDLLWEVEKREIFEYKLIYWFPIEERRRQMKQNYGCHSQSPGSMSDYGAYNEATNNGFDND